MSKWSVVEVVRRWVDELNEPVEVLNATKDGRAGAKTGRVATALALMDFRDYVRDNKGQFAPTGGGGGVRDSLASAKSIGELNAAASAEARRITGRDIPFDMAGSDLQIAREHSEGVLRGLERFPDATLVGVRTYGPGGSGGPAGGALSRQHPTAFAVTVKHGTVENGKFTIHSNIYFNVGAPHDNPDHTRTLLRMAAEDNHLTSGTPRGTALHEFGHVLTNRGGIDRTVYDHAVEQADTAGVIPRIHISRHVSDYASSSIAEYSAEIFADVMEHGDGASALSRSSFAVLEREFHA